MVLDIAYAETIEFHILKSVLSAMADNELSETWQWLEAMLEKHSPQLKGKKKEITSHTNEKGKRNRNKKRTNVKHHNKNTKSVAKQILTAKEARDMNARLFSETM